MSGRVRGNDPDFGEPTAPEDEVHLDETAFIVGDAEPGVDPASNQEIWGKRDDGVADALAERMGAFRRVSIFAQYGKSDRVGRRDRCSDFTNVSIIRPATECLIEDARTLSVAFGFPVDIVEPRILDDRCLVTSVTEGMTFQTDGSVWDRIVAMRRDAADHADVCPRCKSYKTQPWGKKQDNDSTPHMVISSRARQIPAVGHMSVDVYFCDRCNIPVLVSETSKPGVKDARCEVTHSVGELLGARTVVLYANPASVGDLDDIRLEVIRPQADFADSYFGHWYSEIMPAVAQAVNGHGDGCKNLVDDHDRPPTPSGIRALHFGMGKVWGKKTR